MANIPPDELYLQSREALLPYEDARLNSLVQAVANFYLTRNDQSEWGNILRAIAMELSRVEYAYAYDLVNKNPVFLTPPDIRRRWADPLYVSSNWPSPTQFDTTYQMMLVDLIAAYRQGGTVAGIQAVIEAYTGKQIVVEELYTMIGDGFYDQSDRNAIKVSVNVGGNNPLTDITSLNQLQQITQSLYGAIDLAKPAHVGLEFTTIFGTNENLDCLLSPVYLTDEAYQTLNEDASTATITKIAIANNVLTVTCVNNFQQNDNIRFSGLTGATFLNAQAVTVVTASTTQFTASYNYPAGYAPTTDTGIAALITTMQAYYTLDSYVLVNPPLYWKKSTQFSVGDFIVDSNGNIQLVTSITGNGSTGVSQPVWNLNAQGTTLDDNVTWTNISVPVTSVEYANGILTVTANNTVLPGQTVTFSNLGNALFLNPVNVSVPYVHTVFQKVVVLTSTPTQFTAAFADTAYVSGVQVVGGILTITAGNNYQPGMLITFSNMEIATFLNSVPITGTSLTSNVLTVTAQNSFVAGEQVLLEGTAESFLNGLVVTVLSSGLTANQFSANLTHANFSNPADTGTASPIVTVATASPTGFNCAVVFPAYAPAADSGTAALAIYSPTAETQGTACYVPAPDITIAEYQALTPQFQAFYQPYWLNSDCTGVGIDDNLTIIIQGVEQPPFQNMLVLAPFTWNAGTIYSLNDAVTYNGISYSSNQGGNVGNVPSTSAAWTANPGATTTVGAWGVFLPPTLSPTAWTNQSTIQFNVTHTVSDGNNATYTYANLNNSPGLLVPPQLQLHEGELVAIAGCNSSPANIFNGVARIKNVTATTFQIPNSNVAAASAQGSASGIVAPVLGQVPAAFASMLQSAYQLSFGQYVLLGAPPLVTQPLVTPPGTASAYPAINLNLPSRWVEIIYPQTGNNPSAGLPTGEVANFDANFPAGLVAPRLDQVWEISGGDQSYIFGLT